MNNIENDVFTLVKTELITEFGVNSIFVTGEYNPTPSEFPCVYLHEADNFNAGFDGCNHEVVTGVMYEVQVFTNKANGKKAQAKKIMEVIDALLTKYGFTRTFMQQIPNMNDATIFRMVARYTAAVINNVIYRR
jgi:hypothetical protein